MISRPLGIATVPYMLLHYPELPEIRDSIPIRPCTIYFCFFLSGSISKNTSFYMYCPMVHPFHVKKSNLKPRRGVLLGAIDSAQTNHQLTQPNILIAMFLSLMVSFEIVLGG